MKKFISLLLAFTMIFSFAGLVVNADEAETEQESSGSFISNVGNALTFFQYGINDTRVYLVPLEEEGKSEFHITYEENDGDAQDVALGAFYDESTGEVYGTNYTRGVFDSGFNYNVNDGMFYATNDCWQRALGFTPVYDFIANLTAFDYVTRRVYFDYGGEEWCIQLWKGNYGFDLLVGGEIGVYNRPQGSLGFFYNCAGDEDMMPISIKVYDENRTYVDRGTEITWWATGFAFADPVEPNDLTMENTITFPDTEMRDAFVAAAEKQRGVTCTVLNNLVLVRW